MVSTARGNLFTHRRLFCEWGHTFGLGCRVQLIRFAQELLGFWIIASSQCSNSDFYAPQRFIFIAVHRLRYQSAPIRFGPPTVVCVCVEREKFSYTPYVEQLMRQIIDFTWPNVYATLSDL